MTILEPRVDVRRPGAEAFEWLTETVADFKRADPLGVVTIVPPNMVAGRMVLRRLAARGGYVNVRLARLMDVAATIARPWLGAREALTPVREIAAARVAASEVPALRPLAGHLALGQALVRLFRELRRSERSLADLPEDAGAMAHAAARAYQRFRELTAGFVDGTAVRAMAVRRLLGLDQQADPSDIRARLTDWDTPLPRVPELAELGSLLLFLPPRLDPADLALFGALCHHAATAALLADVPDTLGLASRRGWDDERALAAASGLPIAGPRPDRAERLTLPAEVAVVRAPDPAEEAREVVRGVVAAMERGTPLPRIGVLYRQPELYASLLRDAFELAGLPCFSLGGISLAETRPAQVLLSLLRLPERSFAREAVLGVAAASPAFAQPGSPSPATWERLSREANVVRGVDQWTSRLLSYAAAEEARAARYAAEIPPGDEGPAGQSVSGAADRARHTAETVEDLAQALDSPPDGSPWPDFVAWCSAVYERFAGAPEAWPKEEREAAHQLERTVRSLASAAWFESAASASLFRAALEQALGEATLPLGRLGAGVVLGPVQSVAGMAFDEVFLVGLNEGAFPPAPPVDPFFPDEAEDVLGLREQYRGRDREAFLSAIYSAGRKVTLSTADSADGRAAFPSRWLLEIASALAGQPISASAFAALRSADQPWLRVVRSAQEGAASASAPADVEDRRLAEASAWVKAGRRLKDAALARRRDLPLARALQVAEARFSLELTEFDGQVSELAEAAAIARLFNGEHAMSATSIQEWASCPFRFFLGRVLRVRSSEPPEDRWTLDAGARGSLIHAILEEFLRRQAEADPPLGIRAYDDADRLQLHDIAHAHFEELRASGAAGNPLIWEAVAADILADLDAFLREDQAWRAEHGWQPSRFEQRFGFEDEDSWPALELAVGDLNLRFRGVIDRIDLAGDGRRAFLYDYKTGRSDEYKPVEMDPVNSGRALQLAIYAEVARRNLGQPAIDAAYWFISSRGGYAMYGLKQPPEEVAARLQDVLGGIAGGIRQGLFPAVPGDEDEHYGTFDNCRWCDYERVCPNARDQMWLAKRHSPACRAYERLALRVAAQ